MYGRQGYLQRRARQLLQQLGAPIVVHGENCHIVEAFLGGEAREISRTYAYPGASDHEHALLAPYCPPGGAPSLKRPVAANSVVRAAQSTGPGCSGAGTGCAAQPLQWSWKPGAPWAAGQATGVLSCTKLAEQVLALAGPPLATSAQASVSPGSSGPTERPSGWALRSAAWLTAVGKYTVLPAVQVSCSAPPAPACLPAVSFGALVHKLLLGAGDAIVTWTLVRKTSPALQAAGGSSTRRRLASTRALRCCLRKGLIISCPAACHKVSCLLSALTCPKMRLWLIVVTPRKSNRE